VVDDGDELAAAVDALVSRYDQYAERRPAGPAIVVEIDAWKGWTGASGPGSTAAI
jgi:hypothetical protein